MQTYERRISEREQLTPTYAYKYKVMPLSKEAEYVFQDKRTEGTFTFYYDDQTLTEQQRLETVKDGAIRNLAYQCMPGITHRDVTTKPIVFTLRGKPVKAVLLLWSGL